MKNVDWMPFFRILVEFVKQFSKVNFRKVTSKITSVDAVLHEESEYHIFKVWTKWNFCWNLRKLRICRYFQGNWDFSESLKNEWFSQQNQLQERLKDIYSYSARRALSNDVWKKEKKLLDFCIVCTLLSLKSVNTEYGIIWTPA